MDGVFLRVIKAPTEFINYFYANGFGYEDTNFIAFMNNRLSPAVWWEVVLSVPKRPFIKNMLR